MAKLTKKELNESAKNKSIERAEKMRKKLTPEQESNNIGNTVHKAIGTDKEFILIIRKKTQTTDELEAIHNIATPLEVISCLEIIKSVFLNEGR